MKKIGFTYLLLLTISSVTWAQTEKGRWQVGAQVGDFTYQDQNNQTFFSGNLSPSAGYFVANGLVVGAELPLSLATIKYYSIVYPSADLVQNNRTTVGYGLAPFVRYYFGPSKLKPYVGASFTYGLSNGKRTATRTVLEKTEGKYSVIAPTVGVAYFINRSIALNAGLAFNLRHDRADYTYVAPTGQMTTQSTTEYDTKSLSLAIGFQLFFGN